MLFLAFGLGIFIGVAYVFGFPYYNPTYILALGPFCTIVALVPGLVFLFLGLKWRRREQEIVGFAGWVRTYRRITMPELARKLGKSEFETEKVLIDVVDKGLVHGFIDRDRNEFVVQEAIGQEVYVDVCPHCGGRLNRQYLAGETIRCPYCQSVIRPPARKVPKAR